MVGPVAVTALLAVACGWTGGDASSTTTTTTTTAGAGGSPETSGPTTGARLEGTFAVGMTRRDFVDTTRPTPAHGGAPERPERDLPTLVLYPAEGRPGGDPVGGAEPTGGRWPLVVFSHGSTRSGIDYLKTLAVWVAAGYVVVAPDHPLSHSGVPGGTDYGEAPAQAHDVAFVIDRVSELAGGRDDAVLGGRLVPGAVGIAGQSFGAMTSLLAGFHTCCADPAVRAVVSFAGAAVPSSDDAGLATEAAARPLLSIHGDADPTLPYSGEHDGWSRLRGDKYFLTITGGGHDDGFFDGLATPRDRVVALTSLAFLDRYLKEDDEAGSRVRQVVDAAGPSVATLDAR